jgi:RNA polymerase-interacting CarD/CdnL/TRCF family regulator
MKEFVPIYSLGDQVVHRNYGIGRIVGIESKRLNEIEVECFKVKTGNSMYWFPIESTDNPRIHLVATEKLIREAVEILSSAPHGLHDDIFQWKERIGQVQNDGNFLAISSLVRDLSVLKMVKKLTRTQDQALNNLKARMLKEWAASLEVDQKSLQPKLDACLQKSHTIFQNMA